MTKTADCRVSGCFYKRGKSRAGSLPCKGGFSGTPELVETTFRHCQRRIESAYEKILADELKRTMFRSK